MADNESSEQKGHLAGIGRHGEHPYGDLGQIIILFGFLGIWILDSFAFRWSTFLTPHVPVYLRVIFAGGVFMLAIYLVRSGHRAISDEILSSPRLLTDGAFSRVRHPIYLAALLFYVFLIALTLSLISLAVLAGIFIFYDYIAAYEEKLLAEKFGQDYQAYRSHTPKWIPRLKPK
jgi:protein-S-isoprenylcysteine O-methyltransferase Ste14